MGHSLSADKRERQNEKRRVRNKKNVTVLKKEIKRIRAEVSAGKADVKASQSAAYKALDRAARKNAIPKKRASRQKSRLAKALNKQKAAKPATAAQ